MRIMRLKEVMNTTGLGRSSIYKLMSEGRFPRSVSLHARASGWVDEEIEAWVTERIECRDRDAAEIAEAFTHQ